MGACTTATMGAYNSKMSGTFVFLDRGVFESRVAMHEREVPRGGVKIFAVRSPSGLGDTGRMCSLRPARQTRASSAASMKLALFQNTRERDQSGIL